MTPVQLDLLSATEPYYEPVGVSGRLRRLIVVALHDEGPRGLTGEEAAQRCGIRLASSATTRLEELADRDFFPVPLVARGEVKERPTASGRLAYVWKLTDAGRVEAAHLLRSQK